MSLSSFKLMMRQLDVKSYFDKMGQDRDRESTLDRDLCVQGKADRVDFSLLQACLNVYQPELQQDHPTQGITAGLMKAFKNNPDKLVDYLNINVDKGSTVIPKGDFVFLTQKRLGRQFTEVAG